MAHARSSPASVFNGNSRIKLVMCRAASRNCEEVRTSSRGVCEIALPGDARSTSGMTAGARRALRSIPVSLGFDRDRYGSQSSRRRFLRHFWQPIAFVCAVLCWRVRALFKDRAGGAMTSVQRVPNHLAQQTGAGQGQGLFRPANLAPACFGSARSRTSSSPTRGRMARPMRATLVQFCRRRARPPVSPLHLSSALS
jgi:hypothetical protein